MTGSKTIRFYHNKSGKILEKNSELFIDEPRRFKSLTRKSSINNIEQFMKNKFGVDYYEVIYFCEEDARTRAVILDAILNDPTLFKSFDEI